MTVGIPKGLLYYKYYPFIETFFKMLGARVVTSQDTNKEILDLGVKHCIDEACLPVKVFHGHVASIKDQCDLIVIPRIMSVRDREFICPKFCGLPEMVIHSIPNMPKVTLQPIYINSPDKFYNKVWEIGYMITKDKKRIKNAYDEALKVQKQFKSGIKDEGYNLNVILAGHPYNIYDVFTNMNIVKKLNKLGVGVITEEFVEEQDIDHEVQALFKRPFWTFCRNSYGACTYLHKKQKIDGIIYISSFACGIDSVVIELIKEKVHDFPFLILKIDEQTGQAGVDTRIEAFVDMLERRIKNENNVSAFREHIYCSQNPI
jgi:predicted nucleotide-binding protein (sugar kinase/HSP70/actin superfamily)